MRLSEMYYMIRSVLENWIEPEFQEVKQRGNAPSLFLCKGMRAIYSMLGPIRCLPNVEKCLSEIEKVSDSIVEGKSFYLDNNELPKIKNPLNKLHLELDAMRNMCETLGMDSRSDGFDVKLPPSLTLGDAAQCMSDLDIVFSQCPIFPDDTQIKFSGVDIGSIWLTFLIVGSGIAATLRIVAELVDKITVIRSHQLSYRQEEEHLRSLQLSNELLESVVEAHKAALDKMSGDAVQELSERYSVTENEEQERLRMSIDRLGKWIDRGMEIYANINTPKETKLLFPPIERQSLPQEVFKALGEAHKEE